MQKRQYIENDLLNDLTGCFATPNFSFVMEMEFKFQRVVFQKAFSNYLGLEKDFMLYKDFIKAIPREEYSKLTRIHRLFNSFYKIHGDISFSIRFILIHGLKRKNDSTVRILREVYFLPHQKKENSLLCWNNCVDVTNMAIEKGVQFDIVLPQRLQHKRELMMQSFISVVNEDVVCFSNRELEVLKRWVETDSIDLAASSLSISARTLETHLRNMRKKIGVRRTVDVMMYAKERAWI